MKILVTGAAGFIRGYLIQELLDQQFEVIGVDNLSKYGPIEKSYQSHPRYRFVRGDCTDAGLLTRLALECDHLVAGAARIGGIAYFHEYAYDLLAENERIAAATFDAAIAAHRDGRLQKITVLSSSMVYERTFVVVTEISGTRNTIITGFSTPKMLPTMAPSPKTRIPYVGNITWKMKKVRRTNTSTASMKR